MMRTTDSPNQIDRSTNPIARQSAGAGPLSGLLIGLLLVIVISVLLLSQEDPEVGMAP
jgi:hypothetical protein